MTTAKAAIFAGSVQPERRTFPRPVRPRRMRTALPPASALLLSLAVHAGAAAAITLLLAPVEPHMPEPQPMAIMVAFVADPDLQIAPCLS